MVELVSLFLYRLMFSWFNNDDEQMKLPIILPYSLALVWFDRLIVVRYTPQQKENSKSSKTESTNISDLVKISIESLPLYQISRRRVPWSHREKTIANHRGSLNSHACFFCTVLILLTHYH